MFFPSVLRPATVEQQVKTPEDLVMDLLLAEQRRRIARSSEDHRDPCPHDDRGVRDPLVRRVRMPDPRTAPDYLNNNTYHWLVSERSSWPSVAEWIDGAWYCVNEVGPVTPEEMHRRGWRWLRKISPPRPWRQL